MNIAREACGIRTTSSPRVKLMSSLAFNPRFFSPCTCVREIELKVLTIFFPNPNLRKECWCVGLTPCDFHEVSPTLR